MDIFFCITTIAVVTLSVFGAMVLWRLSRVFKHLEHISEQVANESIAVREDLASLRSDMHRGKGHLRSIFGFFQKTAKRNSKTSK